MSAFVTFITTGYIEYFTCGFGNPDWWGCLTGGRILPAAFIAGFIGTMKLLFTQFGLFSQSDVPQYEGPAVPGGRTENVQVFYYVLDTLNETLWLLLELTAGQFILWYSAFAMVGYNTSTFVPWGLVGIIQIFAMIFWTTSLLIRALYNFVNLDYLIKVYDITTYSTITFYDPLGISFSDLNQAEIVIYFEQLVFGNRRSMLYANIMMFLALAIHPLTFIPSWFFLFQIPIGIIFETIVYPIFPQYDTPYVPWTTYIYYALNGFEGVTPEGADIELPEQKDEKENNGGDGLSKPDEPRKQIQ